MLARSNAGNQSLSVLADEINREHDLFEKSARQAIQSAQLIGNKLIEVKDSLPHGQFTGWIASNCKFGERMARNYMRVVKEWPRIEAAQNGNSVAVLGINEALRLVAEPKEEILGELPPEEQELLKNCEERIQVWIDQSNELTDYALKRGPICCGWNDDNDAQLPETHLAFPELDGRAYIAFNDQTPSNFVQLWPSTNYPGAYYITWNEGDDIVYTPRPCFFTRKLAQWYITTNGGVKLPERWEPTKIEILPTPESLIKNHDGLWASPLDDEVAA